MKKLIYIILGIIIGALAMYYYCANSLEVTNEDIAIVKPKGVTSVKDAKALNDNWTKFRQAAVDSAAKKQGRNKDDRSVWWSIEDIENYIAFSKNETSNLGFDMTGMRIYLGVYGDNAGRTKKNLTTMFWVPTVKKAKEEASFIPTMFQLGNDCPTCPPLNAGQGGGGSYPQ